MSSMRGWAAIITGCGQPDGMGSAIARALAAKDCVVLVTDVHPAQGMSDQLDALVDELSAQGASAEAFRANVADDSDCRATVARAIARFGRIDVLVNNAGADHGDDRVPATEVSLGEWQRLLDVNLTGAFLMARYAARHMVEQKRGRIVNICSLAAVLGVRDRAAYSASKAGLLGVTRALASELAASGVTANAVLPGSIATRRAHSTARSRSGSDDIGGALAAQAQKIPVGRIGKAEDVAAAVAYFASPEASYVTGQVLAVDGGWSACLP